MMKLFKNEDAFTGLEAAIVLIAFIVVAAVFSYVMLGAGFFATGEAQKVVHTGSQQASTSLEIIGNVYGTTDAAKTTAEAKSLANIEALKFSVGNTAGGTPLDISQMLVTIVCEGVSEVIPYDKGSSIVSGGSSTLTAGHWAVTETYNDVGGTVNHLLESGEQFVMEIKFSSTTAGKLKSNTPFSVNLQPAVGAVYPIKKTVPSNIYEVNIIN